MKILIAGGNGLVGRALVAHCRAQGDAVTAPAHAAWDIADERATQSLAAQVQPDYIINCAAWTDVDGCERAPERAFRENAQGPETLARAARDVGAGLLTISTDYVFDGTKEGFYDQRDQPHATSVYAASKIAGERRPLEAWARTIIVRTGWIFGPGGRNFLSHIIERTRAGQHLTAISDAYGTPTYAVDLAERLRELVLLDLPGVWHIVNSGQGVSYEEFTRHAVAAAGLSEKSSVQGILSATLQRPAARPANTRLKCLWSERVGLPAMPDWMDAVGRWISAA